MSTGVTAGPLNEAAAARHASPLSTIQFGIKRITFHPPFVTSGRLPSDPLC
jgi:hypothetical protein